MRTAFLVLGIPALVGAHTQGLPDTLSAPPFTAGRANPGPQEEQPILLGEASAETILAHRRVFREQLGRVVLAEPLKARWRAIRQPFTLVAVFGSWCGDSHYQLPDLLALNREPNPFVEVHYLGVARDKRLEAAQWPAGCAPQAIQRVPTFYLFSLEPGGGQRLVGTIVENPPRAGQTMAEALVELLERASRP